MKSFRYTPLDNPATDIRLLKCTESAGAHDPLRFQISAWPIDSAPPYHAISYTWGDLTFTKITVEGCELKVRRNCYESLVQCLGHDATAYIWIDSICINQQDVSEKSHQVARMHAIYASARQVLVCVGAHDGGSEFLVRVCGAIGSRALGRCLDEEEIQDVVTDLAIECTGLTRDEIASRIHHSFIAFAERVYWTRLWIVQEIVAGADNLFVLCGMDSIAWENLTAIEGILWILLGIDGHDLRSPLCQLVQLSSEILSSEGSVPLRDLMIQLDDAKCTDPRDRVYGLLALINWEDSGLDPIVPDYGRSAWDIAVRLLPSLSPYDCPRVMRRLQIDNATAEMQQLIGERLVPTVQAKDSSLTHGFNFQRMMFIRLVQEKPGVFRMDRGDSQKHPCFDPSKFIIASGLMHSWNELEHRATHPDRPQRLYFGDQLIALLSSEAISGDLVCFSPFHDMDACLVLRIGDSQYQKLDAVGAGNFLTESRDFFREQAFKHAIPGMRTRNIPTDATFQAELRVSAMAEDIMVLLGDFNTDYCRLLDIQPIRSSAGAAELVPWQPRQESKAYWKLNSEVKAIRMDRMKVKLSEPWNSAAVITDEYTHKNASLIVVFRAVEFTIQAASTSLVARFGQYDTKVDIVNDPGAHGREVVFAAYKALRENVLELFASQLRALAPEPKERRTLQDAAGCAKFALLRDRHGRIETTEEPQGPSFLIRPLDRTALGIEGDVRCVEAANVLPLDSSTSIASLEGEASLICRSGTRKVFFRLAANGYSEVFKRELSCLRKLSECEEAVRIPRFLAAVTAANDGPVVGFITDWIEGSSLVEVADRRMNEHRERWMEEVDRTVSFLHDQDIIWGGVDAKNVLIDCDKEAWVVDFSGGLSTAVQLVPTSENKEREKEAMQKLFEDQSPPDHLPQSSLLR